MLSKIDGVLGCVELRELGGCTGKKSEEKSDVYKFRVCGATRI